MCPRRSSQSALRLGTHRDREGLFRTASFESRLRHLVATITLSPRWCWRRPADARLRHRLPAAEPRSAIAMTSTLVALLLAASPQNSVSAELPAFLWSGVELDGERFLTPHVSLQVALGGRWAAQGDFGSL